MRAVKHGDVVKINIFVAELENALCHEPRLFRAVIQWDESRLQRFRFASCAELLAELMHICGDGGIRDRQNFWHAAIIHLDLEHLRFWITLWELKDVLKIGASPGVD